ncbi:MAG TPA: PAS domain-containing protein [Allosphingosinicella sp.]|nr:PAS domain-containing protein [Allosphingosinicella sp.]
MDEAVTEASIAVVGPEEDAAAVAAILERQGYVCHRPGTAKLLDEVRRGAISILVLSAEALGELDVQAFQASVERQPTWSDLPILLLVHRHEAARFAGVLDELGQVRLVERPIEPFILARAVAAALRSRQRQSGARAALAQLEEARAKYRAISETLEHRVSERTKQLESAYDRLVSEAEERWMAEERLRESEELYRYTVELSQQLVWTADAGGTIQTVSRQFEAVTGFGEEVTAHEGWLRSVHPDDLGRVLEHWQSAVAEGRRAGADFRMRQADGSYRMVRARAAPRRDEAGKIIRWYGTIEDIEEQTRADSARRAADERYRLAVYATNDAIWDLDVLTNRIEWTASATGFFGHDAGAATSLGWWEAQLHPEDRERVTSGLAAAIEGGRTHWADLYRFRRADGDYADVYDQGHIVRDEQGRARRAVGAMADVTDRQRAEAELRRMQSELIHVSRLSAMGAMASTLAHEINQPLTAIGSYVSGSRRLLKQLQAPAVSEIADALQAAEAATQRAGQIVRRLRELVARGNVAIQAEDLPKLIADACTIALVDAHLLGISHHIKAAEAARWVYADRIQIQQVLINLLRNAVQAMTDQPRRTITIRTAAKPGGKVEVSVADTGTGFANKAEDVLFSPFRSTKPDGMGIGLSISRTIIEAHGGKIWAERRRGGGAVFRFTLPAADESALDDDGLALAQPAGGQPL